MTAQPLNIANQATSPVLADSDIGSGLRQSILDLDTETACEFARCIGELAESASRRRIATAWANGWIVGDHAMEILIALDLIESPEVSE
jgi:hypothetical protein